MTRLDWRVVGLSLGSLLAISYVLCVAYDLAFEQRMYEAWLKLLPGFTWLIGTSFSSGSSNRFSTASPWGFCSRRSSTISHRRYAPPNQSRALEFT